MKRFMASITGEVLFWLGDKMSWVFETTGYGFRLYSWFMRQSLVLSDKYNLGIWDE